MSVIKVDNIRIASESVSRPATGVAAAWVNFDGTGTVAIRDSVNVSSITDSGTGNYAPNYASNMSNGDYSVSGAIPYAAWEGTDKVVYYNDSETSSKMRIQTLNPFSNYYDVSSVFGIAHGELA